MAGYRLNKLKENTHVAYWADPRGPGHGNLERGFVSSHIGDTVLITWTDGAHAGVVEEWRSGDLRFRVDRGQAILTAPPKPRRIRRPANELWCKTCGTRRDIGCECPRPGALKPEFWSNKSAKKALTSAEQDDSIDLSINRGEGNPTQKGAKSMATKTKKKKKEAEELDDFVELEEVDEADDDDEVDPSDGKLSAKEAATAIGTDARTLRKFLRKKAGKVGQGNRWLIDPDDLDDLKQEFEASLRSSKSDDADEEEEKPKAKKTKKTKKTKKAKTPKPDSEIYDEDEDEFEVLDEIDDL